MSGFAHNCCTVRCEFYCRCSYVACKFETRDNYRGGWGGEGQVSPKHGKNLHQLNVNTKFEASNCVFRNSVWPSLKSLSTVRIVPVLRPVHWKEPLRRTCTQNSQLRWISPTGLNAKHYIHSKHKSKPGNCLACGWEQRLVQKCMYTGGGGYRGP